MAQFGTETPSFVKLTASARHPGRKTAYETLSHQTEAPKLVEPSIWAVPVEAPLEPLEVSA